MMTYKNKKQVMENIEPGKPEETSSNTNKSFTPHELVEYHMQHPDEPITDADMENLDLSLDENPSIDEIKLTPEEKKNADELADAIKSDSTGMSYRADI